MLITMRRMRSIAPSCDAFATIWPCAAPMASASGIRKTSVWRSGIAGWQSSIFRNEAPSQWRVRMAGSSSLLMARFTTIGNCELRWRRRAACSARGPTRRSCCTSMPKKAKAMVEDLRGMFAFGLWDAEKKALLLARDPYGIKPLYYADDGWTFRFASQVKALLAGGKISRDHEPAGWVGFCLFGSVPEPFTTYQDIRALPAGSTLWVDHIGPRETKQYFSVAGTYCSAEVSNPMKANEDLEGRCRDALLDSVRHHLVADVPVGAFLSSGIDSGALVGLMRDAGQQDVQTVTLAFEEFRGTSEDEAPIAQEVAATYGTRHTTRFVSEREFRDDLPKILEAMDQPTIDGLNTWFVSKAARELGLKVAISGLGGDELVRRLSVISRCAALGAPAGSSWAGSVARRSDAATADGV